MLEIGTRAPEFLLPDQNGTVHSLADYKGQKVILYFYPKDMTGAARHRPVIFATVIRSCRKRELSYLA